MGKFFNYIIPRYGIFYNGFYGVKGYCWLGKVKGEVIRAVYSTGFNVGDKVTLNSKLFFKIKNTEDFPFDLYDRY